MRCDHGNRRGEEPERDTSHTPSHINLVGLCFRVIAFSAFCRLGQGDRWYR
jgi:hypothetical protein